MNSLEEVILSLGRIEGKLEQIHQEGIPARVSSLEQWKAKVSGSINSVWIALCAIAGIVAFAVAVVMAYVKQ